MGDERREVRPGLCTRTRSPFRGIQRGRQRAPRHRRCVSGACHPLLKDASEGSTGLSCCNPRPRPPQRQRRDHPWSVPCPGGSQPTPPTCPASPGTDTAGKHQGPWHLRDLRERNFFYKQKKKMNFEVRVNVSMYNVNYLPLYRCSCKIQLLTIFYGGRAHESADTTGHHTACPSPVWLDPP